MNSTTTFLAILLASAGYFSLYQVAAANAYSRRNRPLIAVVVLFIYLMVGSAVVLLFLSSGDNPMIVFGSLLLFAVVALGLIVRYMAKHWRSINKVALIILILYLALVAYLTLTMRFGTTIKTIQMVPLSRISQAVKEWDLALMEHDYQNMLMFVPLGILIPLLHPHRFNKFSYAFLSGVILSTGIETTQLLYQLGICDIDDIIANTVGAVVGYLVCAFYLRVTRNWKLF